MHERILSSAAVECLCFVGYRWYDARFFFVQLSSAAAAALHYPNIALYYVAQLFTLLTYRRMLPDFPPLRRHDSIRPLIICDAVKVSCLQQLTFTNATT